MRIDEDIDLQSMCTHVHAYMQIQLLLSLLSSMSITPHSRGRECSTGNGAARECRAQVRAGHDEAQVQEHDGGEQATATSKCQHSECGVLSRPQYSGVACTWGISIACNVSLCQYLRYY